MLGRGTGTGGGKEEAAARQVGASNKGRKGEKDTEKQWGLRGCNIPTQGRGAQTAGLCLPVDNLNENVPAGLSLRDADHQRL